MTAPAPAEAAIEPDLPIIDPHHHVRDRFDGRYLFHDYLADLSSCGHNIRATVVIESGDMARADGPSELAPVGEVEFLNGVAAMFASGKYGPTLACAGIVGCPDLSLGDAVRPVPLHDETTDLYIVTERFHAQFCADVPAPEAARMAATQRPVTQEALTEPSGGRPLWRELPSWFVIGEQDRNIPAALQRFLAERAGARRTIEIPGASHAVPISHPQETAEVILQAAALPATT